MYESLYTPKSVQHIVSHCTQQLHLIWQGELMDGGESGPRACDSISDGWLYGCDMKVGLGQQDQIRFELYGR